MRACLSEQAGFRTIYARSMLLYRILKTPYLTDPLATIGAAKSPGRWNPKGKGILYTASSPALALLETLVHFERVPYADLPQMRLFTLEIDDAAIRYVRADLLPNTWKNPADIRITQELLSDWIDQPSSLAVGVPSAILDVSYNFLLAPNHPDYAAMRIANALDLMLDTRLWRVA